MGSMQRFNRISGVICLLLACAPMRRIMGKVKPWVWHSHRPSLPEFISMVMVACKTLQRHLQGFIKRRLKEMRRRKTIWPRYMRVMTAYYLTKERPIVGADWQPSTGIAAQKAGWGSCLNLEKVWRKAGCRRICGTALPFQTEIKPPHFGGILWQVILSPTKF